ncbi:CASP-like protein 1U1 [Panicum virgatum]|uniref:CASP-like protein 1U1 n=1 Tax=Panicum virgatum TaxID=38727 RepID=UPI0019D530F4|nr:CASP-like protein 1U1 [Panicum virgatum]
MADGEAGKAVSLLFRITALVLSVAAAVVMGTASQLVVVDGDRGAPSSYAVSYSQYNALKYFVAAHASSAVCSAVALYLCAVRAAAAIGSLPLVLLLDAAAQGLLFSAAGAVFAVRGVVDICQMGLDQRKVNMLARGYCEADYSITPNIYQSMFYALFLVVVFMIKLLTAVSGE